MMNLIILIGLMAYVGATMTLPGIAGFVLTMGIGVDSNVLIFERIKEELEARRGVRASVNAGFGRVLWTLLDTHVASLISAAFLFLFGTGPIRGFAMTLVLRPRWRTYSPRSSCRRRCSSSSCRGARRRRSASS